MAHPTVTPTSTLPAPRIVDALLNRFYGSDRPEAGASSHWRDFAGRFRVSRDARNASLVLRGFGFGNAAWVNVTHRLFDEMTIAAHLVHLRNRHALLEGYRRLRLLGRRMGVDPTFDAFRQVCSLEVIAKGLPPGVDAAPRVLIIGDGHGILAALMKDRWPAARITLVDLGRTLLFQTVNCQRAFPDARHVLAGVDDLSGADFVYCPADQLAALESQQFDVAVNIASMQEMRRATVAQYFAFLRRRLVAAHVFYCCNRVRKVLPDGEASVLAEYPWRAEDRVFFDEPCPWHQYYLAASGRVLTRYDGVHRHRLVTLAVDAVGSDMERADAGS